MTFARKLVVVMLLCFGVAACGGGGGGGGDASVSAWEFGIDVPGTSALPAEGSFFDISGAPRARPATTIGALEAG